MLNLLIGIVIGIIWYPAIIAFIEVMKTKSVEELEKGHKLIADSQIENKIMLVIVFIIRIPLLLIMLIPLFGHVFKVYYKESK